MMSTCVHTPTRVSGDPHVRHGTCARERRESHERRAARRLLFATAMNAPIRPAGEIPDPQRVPYRDAAAPAPRGTRRTHWRWLVVAFVVAFGVWLTRIRRNRAAPTVADAPAELLDGARRFPVAEPDLDPAVPLAPLLAADSPERLALLEPDEGALNLRYGETIRVRFNRPMVDGLAVGRTVERPPLRFAPRVEGRARWSTRSTLTFVPDAAAWSRPLEATMHLDGALRSLSGETLGTVEPRSVVFDSTPHLLDDETRRRLHPGQPARLVFSGQVDVAQLAPHMMAYELSGGRRTLRFSLGVAGHDSEGRNLVQLRLARALEPGARFALVVSPMLAHYDDDEPHSFEFQLEPRPQIEAYVCPMNATDADQCSTTRPQGTILDIGEELRVVSSVALAIPAQDAVRVAPPVANLTTRVQSRLLALRADWVPGQVYEVRLDDLRDTTGAPIRRPPPLAVRSAGRSPEVRTRAGRLTFEHDAAPTMPLAAIHAELGSVRYAAVPPEQEFLAALDPTDAGAWARQLAWTSTPMTAVAADSRPNRWGRGEFAWRDPRAGRVSNMGILAFRADALPTDGTMMGTGNPTVAFVQATDLGIAALSLEDGVFVSITSISTAVPVANAAIAVARDDGRVVAAGSTDARGTAWIGLPRDVAAARVAIRATHGVDRAVTVVDPRTAIRPAQLGLATAARQVDVTSTVVGVFTDRGVYRPGDTVHVAALARTLDGTALRGLTRGRFTVQLVDANGIVVGPPTDRPVNSFGALATDLVVPLSAEPGAYSVHVALPQNAHALASAEIQVAEFRWPTMRVDLAPIAGEPTEGDALHADVVATYLFGAPAAGLIAHWSLQRVGAAPMPTRWDRYAFAAAGVQAGSGTAESGEAPLGPHGELTLNTHVSQGAPVRARATLEVEVRDHAGQGTSARRTFVTYPARYEIGIHDGAAWLEPHATLDVDAVVIAHDGTPVAGRRVDARIVREGWHSYWEWSRAPDETNVDAGSYQTRRSRTEDVVQRCALTSASSPVHCVFTPSRPGTYLLEATTRDDSGRTVTASRRVYVAGPGEHPDRDPPGAPIAVTPSQRQWLVGDRARIAFESPWADADALVTVERRRVLHVERRRVPAGGNVFELPVTAEMVPDATVTVVLTRPRTGPPRADIDLGAPDLRFGATQLDVRSQSSPLAVRLALASARVEPGADVAIDVTVLDARGAPVRSQVTLYAVDEGVLRLTDYTVPDPISSLVARRGAWFSFDDIRRTLVARLDPLALPTAGGDGGSSAARSLRDERDAFDPTPLWLPSITTDSNGRAHTTFHTPERPATYRIMAVAWNAQERSGRASTMLTATRPIVLRPALPRVVTAGDDFDAALFAHNPTETPADATVQCTVDGVARGMHRVHLEPGADVRIVERVRTGESDATRVHCEGHSGATRDTFTSVVEIAPRGRRGQSLTVGGVAGVRDIEIALPSGALPRGATFSMDLAPHPFVGFEAAIDSMASREDADADELSSEIMALAAMSSMDAGAVPGEGRPPLAQRAAHAIDRLLGLQNQSGHFGRYTPDDPTDPYVTAFAMHALESARARGWRVAPAARERGLTSLAAMVRGTAFLDSDATSGLDALALALRVLAAAGRADSSRASATYDQRDRLSPFGLAQLALALPASDHRREALVQRAARAVLATRETERADPSLLRWYDTSARTLGAVLEAVARIDSSMLRGRTIASRLLRARTAEGGVSWGSPHENAHALSALAAYAQIFRETGAIATTVTLDGNPIGAQTRSAARRRVDIPTATLASGRHVLRIVARPFAFYALRGQWRVGLGPAESIARGRDVAVHRVLETESGMPLAAGAHVRLGDLVRIRLFVFTESTPPPFATLVDRIAGGFEAVDATLHSSPQASLSALLGAGPDDDGAIDPRGYYASRSLADLTRRSFSHGSARFTYRQLTRGLHEVTYGVRATTSGSFTLPPAEISGMYARRYLARSTATTVVVDP